MRQRIVFVRIPVLIQRCPSTVDNTVNRQTLRDEFAAVEVHCTVKHWTFLLHGPTCTATYNLVKEKSTLQVIYY